MGKNNKKISDPAQTSDIVLGDDIDDDDRAGEISKRLLQVMQQLKEEVRRLKDRNEVLASETGNEATLVEESDNATILVNQIQELKAANQSLLDHVNMST